MMLAYNVALAFSCSSGCGRCCTVLVEVVVVPWACFLVASASAVVVVAGPFLRILGLDVAVETES